MVGQGPGKCRVALAFSVELQKGCAFAQGKSKRRKSDRIWLDGQPFSACRCLLSEPRRLIFALAIRTASARVDCFFETFFGFLPVTTTIGCDCINVIEPCTTGCTLMGPVNGGFGRGMPDNAWRANWFNPASEESRL